MLADCHACDSAHEPCECCGSARPQRNLPNCAHLEQLDVCVVHVTFCDMYPLGAQLVDKAEDTGRDGSLPACLRAGKCALADRVLEDDAVELWDVGLVASGAGRDVVTEALARQNGHGYFVHRCLYFVQHQVCILVHHLPAVVVEVELCQTPTNRRRGSEVVVFTGLT
jgi:hypothetical protein